MCVADRYNGLVNGFPILKMLKGLGHDSRSTILFFYLMYKMVYKCILKIDHNIEC